MKKTNVVWSLVISLFVSLGLHQYFSGSHVLATQSDTHTFWIGPISTTAPFVFWALITFAILSLPGTRPIHTRATQVGYAAGWLAMTTFGLWIISLPQGPHHSSTMGIAVFMTPFLFAPIFPLFFILGYLSAKFLLHSPLPISN